ncbi:hypothetical protein BK129_20340 [Paenibacillus amylolyticus]|uniref:hypothetical protein n=1 Tax=Paenibacillus TaxID=44249 RepID=UPI00096DA1F2|nr:hypothetical protein [Paenibacillus amylolyticus]OMF03646.1 hypothetical protein BK129_20340 [Paenibacillus amylolyticus]
MKDEEKAVQTVLNFLNDDSKRTLLMRGYDTDAKLRVVFSCLNKIFDRGIISTSSMSNVSELINHAFKIKLLPDNVKSTSTYELGDMEILITSYATSTKFKFNGNENTFTTFFPVQTILNDSKRYEKFLLRLKDNNSRKIIFVTTNEWSINDWDIEKYVDEIFFFEVENDNPELMVNLRSNGAI